MRRNAPFSEIVNRFLTSARIPSTLGLLLMPVTKQLQRVVERGLTATPVPAGRNPCVGRLFLLESAPSRRNSLAVGVIRAAVLSLFGPHFCLP
jgi:hypothetical protein